MSLENYENYYPGEVEIETDEEMTEINIDSINPIQDKVRRIVANISTKKNLYRYFGRLAIIKNGKLFIAFDLHSLSIILATEFQFYKVKVTKSGESIITYHSLDDDHLRLLQEMIKDATLREITIYSNIPVIERESEDKYRLCTLGFNSLSGIYIGENNLKPVHQNIHIEKALSGFSFKSTVDKTNVIGFYLTGLVHHMFPGRVPSIRIEGNQRNIGKTLLAMNIAINVQGKEGHILSLSDNEDEIEKRLCALVINGESVAIFDNVKPSKHLKEVGGSLLERLITSITLQFRLLGSNTIFSAPNRLLTIITTNGAESSPDFASRTVAIELFVRGNPIGKKFEHKDLIKFITDNLENIRCELLGMFEIWIQAGCPLSTNTVHRFQPWAELIGGVLEANGYLGFLSNQKEFEQSTGIVAEFEKCIEMMPKNTPMPAKRILGCCKPKNDFFYAFDNVSTFSKKILMPLIGQDFMLDGVGRFVFESAGINSDKSALFSLNLIENYTVPEEPEVPEHGNLLLLSKKLNEVKTLFDLQEDAECFVEK